MVPRGKWVPVFWFGRDSQKESKKVEIEKIADDFGRYILRSRVWVEDEGVVFEGGASGIQTA